MQHALDVLLAFAGQHPTAALVFIGLVALAESLAIVGTLVPAGIVMFAAGALVGHGTLQLAWTIGVAAAGAIAGDALSYELGRHGQDRVRAWPLFQRHADAIGRAERLVARKGALSVVLARFTGAVRAFVPLLAGFARMPARTFYATNVASALLWAPAHILPGAVFGASLRLAEQASGRLAVLVLLLAGLTWGAVWIARFTIRTAGPLSRTLRARVLRAMGTRSSWWARFMRLLLDPARPGSEALLAAFVILLGSMWLFLGVLEDVVSRDPLVVADRAVFTFLQQLRTDPADGLMVAITQMGSVGVMLPLIVVVAAWLVFHRSWRTAGYWIGTSAGAEAVVQVLKGTLGRHRPLALYHGVEQYSFPSGHATIAAVVLAWLAFLLTRGQPRRWRMAVGGALSIYVALVGFSRLYLGAHWLSDVLGGFAFGLAAAALSAMVYTQHGVQEVIRPKGLALAAGATIAIAGGAWHWWRAPADLQRYAAIATPMPTTLRAWITGGFRQLPAHRRELAGERREAFTIQVACGESALRDALRRAGWEPAPGLSVAALLQAIAPHPNIGALPVLPGFDEGRASKIEVMQVPAPVTNARDVMRLWQSDWNVGGGGPVWYGAAAREVQIRPDYGFLHPQALPAREFTAGLARAGLRRVDAGTKSDERVPELWACTGS